MEASHQVMWLKLHIINDLPTSWLVYWQPEDLHWPNHIHLSVNRIPKVPTNHSCTFSYYNTVICMVSCICFHSMYIIGSPTFTRLHFYRLVLVAVADFLSLLQSWTWWPLISLPSLACSLQHIQESVSCHYSHDFI